MSASRILFPLLLLLLQSPAAAQFGHLLSFRQAPQAKSQEELDSYLEIYTRTNPAFRVEAVNRFASIYPGSELLGLSYQYQMSAYQELNDYAGVLQAGEKALLLMPRNLNTLITLAVSIPNGVAGRSDATALLLRADGYAHQALEELREFKVPQEVPLADWEVQRSEMEAQCHEALGHIFIKRGDPVQAVRELQAAVSFSPRPEGRQFLRLSSAYLLNGQYQEAEGAARRATELSKGELRELALGQLRSIQARRKP